MNSKRGCTDAPTDTAPSPKQPKVEDTQDKATIIDPEMFRVGTELMAACDKGDVVKVKQLLSNKHGEASYQDEETGTSVLMTAALNGHKEIVELLIDGGAPWNALDRKGRCAGEYAIDAGHQDIVNYLVDVGVRAELVLGAVEDAVLERAPPPNEEYLSQSIVCDKDKIVDENKDAVMMSWETPLMEMHAKIIAQGGNKSLLNVGFGMGIIDGEIQKLGPEKHTIVEAHPDVYKRMIDAGWDKKENVRVVFGRWQDVIDQLETYDGIFFDTYGEYYRDLKQFQSHLPKLLRPGGVYSFFNGLCPRNIFFHGVYCQIAQLDLEALGMETAFHPVAIDTKADKIWDGVKRRYWWNDTYYLPVALLKKSHQGDEAGVKADDKMGDKAGDKVDDSEGVKNAGAQPDNNAGEAASNN